MAETTFDIFKDSGITPATDLGSWISNYKERFISSSHDQSMLSLATPDDAVIVVGPPRLAQEKVTEGFHVVGFVNTLQYSEQSQVQPMKAIGSRRHIFSRTNTPVNGSIGKLMVFGPNLVRALYSRIDVEGVKHAEHNQFSSADNLDNALWLSNLEEDIFRIPFGMGVIYQSPGMEAKSTGRGLGAEYFESMVLVNRSVSVQSGQTMIMENISFMADRVIPLTSYSFDGAKWDTKNLLATLSSKE